LKNQIDEQSVEKTVEITSKNEDQIIEKEVDRMIQEEPKEFTTNRIVNLDDSVQNDQTIEAHNEEKKFTETVFAMSETSKSYIIIGRCSKDSKINLIFHFKFQTDNDYVLKTN